MTDPETPSQHDEPASNEPTDLVRVSRDGHVLLIGVYRSAKRNAWNMEIIRRVAAAYNELRDDPELRVGVIYGDGDHFSAGLDLAEVAPAMAAGEPFSAPGDCDPFNMTGEPCPKPVVVAVQGRCYTLGIELILASQISVAASDTIFAQLEVARGIVPFGGGAHRLPATAGAQGMRWLLTAEEFSAQQAFDASMVTEIVEPGQQRNRALELAHQIAANSPAGVQAALASCRAAERSARDAAASSTSAALPGLLAGPDAQEGVAAMIERRPPVF